jgi:hypothetical protein
MVLFQCEQTSVYRQEIFKKRKIFIPGVKLCIFFISEGAVSKRFTFSIIIDTHKMLTEFNFFNQLSQLGSNLKF